jgi:MoaA/NifB/PqqE/SkfB family radical SAM enzyme
MNWLAHINNLRRMAPWYYSRDGFAEFPGTIFVTVNSTCNLKCRMCDVGMAREDTAFSKNLISAGMQSLPIEILRELILDVTHFHPEIAVVATEPLIYKELYNFADCVKNAGLNFHVTSNGLILDRHVEKILDHRIDSLALSIDALGERHDYIRGVDGTFAKVTEAMRTLFDKRAERKSPLKVMINATITPDNYHCLYDFYRYFSYYPVEQITFSHMNYITEEMANVHNKVVSDHQLKVTSSSLTDESDLHKIEPKVLAKQIELIKSYNGVPAYFTPDLVQENDILDFYTNPKKVMSKKKCVVPWFSTQINASGDVAPLARCFNVTFGNLHQNSFGEIWNGEAYRTFRRDLKKNRLYPACTRCCGIL